MEPQWPPGEDTGRAKRTRATIPRPRTYPFRRHYRQPVGEDDAKRGQSGEDTIGFDGNKKIKGRKRHLLVDTNGLVLTVFVTAADLDEREGAKSLLTNGAKRFPRLSKLWADSGYTGPFGEWVKQHFGIEVEIIKRTEDLKGFQIVPRRWVVERTFGGFGRFKRLSKDYELLPERSESMIYLAMMRLMPNRLTA